MVSIRRLVQLLILETETDRNQLAGHARRLKSEILKDWEQEIPSIEAYTSHEAMLDEKYFYALHGRRDIKKHWMNRAYATPKRKDFWNGNRIKCVHWIGFIKKSKKEIGLLNQLRNYTDRTYSSRSPELSTVGYVDSVIYPHGSIGISFQKRKITWAYLADSFTEFISSVGHQSGAKYNSGKIPKRPFLGISRDNCILGPEDMKGDIINEIIISGYSGPIFILSRDKLSDEGLTSAKAIIAAAGQKFEII